MKDEMRGTGAMRPQAMQGNIHRTIQGTGRIVLASGSEIRRRLLENAAVPFETMPVKLDEEAIRQALVAEGRPARDIADALAEAKARKAGMRAPDALVIGCDQVLEFEGRILSKPASPKEGAAQLAALNGREHRLFSAAVICEGGQPVWRHVGEVRLQMRQVSQAWLEDYLSRNWQSVRHSVGCYKLEEEGVRLFSRIEGDYFNVLGLPLLELLGYLTIRGVLPG
jgi:septum formation protein